MGTSTNQPSPSTPSWHAAQAAYHDSRISTERAVQELWRAATHRTEGDLVKALASAVIARCGELAATESSRENAVRDASLLVAFSGEASLASDIAQRALIKAFRSPADRLAAFSANLFAEASDYLVSRDLPGFVGQSDHIGTPRQAIEFKAAIRDTVLTTVQRIPRPVAGRLEGDWAAYVRRVAAALKSGPERSE